MSTGKKLFALSLLTLIALFGCDVLCAAVWLDVFKVLYFVLRGDGISVFFEIFNVYNVVVN